MERFYIVRLDTTAQHERQFDRQDQVLARELHLQFGKDAQVWKASEDMAGGWYPDTKDPVAYEEYKVGDVVTMPNGENWIAITKGKTS